MELAGPSSRLQFLICKRQMPIHRGTLKIKRDATRNTLRPGPGPSEHPVPLAAALGEGVGIGVGVRMAH